MTAAEHGGHPLPAELIHDLRAPLNQVIGYAEMLMEEVEAAGHPAYLAKLRRIHAAGYQMLAVIEARLRPSGVEAEERP